MVASVALARRLGLETETVIDALAGSPLVSPWQAAKLEGTVALSRNVPGKPSKVGLSFMAGGQERVEPLDRAYHLLSLGGEVEAVARGDRSMQQCPP